MASAVIGALRVNLGIDTAAFSAGLTQAQGKLANFSKSVQPAITAVAAFGSAAALAGAALVTALVNKQLQVIDTQSKLAARLGGTVAAIQTLDQAANLAGVSSEDLAKSMGVLNARLGEAARTGAGAAFEAFKALGLSIQDLAAMDVDKRLSAISDRMKELGYSTQQQADFLRQVGIRSQEMMTLMQGGGDAIRSARKDIEDFGIAVSDIDAKKIEMANDAITQISVVAAGVGNQIATRLAPYIAAIATGFSNAARSGKGFGATIDLVMAEAVKSVGWLLDALRKGDTLMAYINMGITKAARGTRLLITAGLADVSEFDTAIAGMQDRLKDVENSKMPSRQLDEFMAKAKLTADLVAKMQLGGDNAPADVLPPTATSDKDKAASERRQSQLDAQLQQLQLSLLTEREAEQNSYAERMVDLQGFLDAGMVTKQQYAEMALAIEADHAKQVQALDKQTADEAAKNAQNRMAAMNVVADSVSSILGSLFGESKAAAYAQTIISTAQAVMTTFAQYGATPWGFAAAGAVAAAGVAQLATIARTSKDGGGSKPSVSSAAAPAASGGGGQEQPGSSSTLFVQGISSSQLFSGDAVRDLAQKLIDYQADGGKVVLA